MASDYKTIRQVADEWGVTVRRVQMLCNDGKIPGAIKYGKSWILPVDVVRPFDKRSLKGRRKDNALSEKAKSEAIHQMNQMFLLNMSYEIRTSLNTMLNFADMVCSHKEEPQKIDEYVENIRNAGRNILNFTSNAIEVAKLEVGEVHLEETVCNVESVLQRRIDNIEKEIEKNEITLRRKSEICHEFFRADREKLERVLENVLEIMLRFTRPQSTVLIKTEETQNPRGGKNMLRITIEDDGCSISESYLGRLNEGNIGEMAVVRDIMPGIGLRVTVVKKLVTLMKGSITFESHLGFVNKVIITLPLKVADFSEVQEEDISTMELSRLVGKRVLLAEDNELNREMTAEILSEAGMQVECAEDGILCVATLERAQADYFDLILMDIQMPNLNGLMATKVIRALEDKRKSRVPIVALTADVKEANRTEALEIGMNGFVIKPCDRNTLLTVLHNVLVHKDE